MNFIFLDSKSIYLFVILLILMFAISIGCLICAFFVNRKNEQLNKMLLNEREKTNNLRQYNLALKLKYGELEDEKR